MFKLMKFLAWTACAVGFGIFLAQHPVDGRTPVEHLQRAWKRNVAPSGVDKLKVGLRETLDDAKESLASRSNKPRDNYSEEERAAIDRLIAPAKAR